MAPTAAVEAVGLGDADGWVISRVQAGARGYAGA